ncbi:DUF229 domain-containing protein [candidate division WS5 bacterium]|uniref:DUF229 domain-containing protein n=1 Tax=candidate division WS5 bacterium TaxID=2093353 RepID=A0A419DDT6_9BACT|nr:MAG: DUF229 domain-containing protein [candidate division WS5 bacterium]
MTTPKIFYLNIFRPVFVLFSLYLIGDVFYRLDGFKHFASFSEILPGVILIITLWGIMSIFSALFIWLILLATEWICLGLKIRIEKQHLLLYSGILFFIVVILWIFKRHLLLSVPIPFQQRVLALTGAILISIFITWLLRKKSERLIDIIQKRIAPLVWLFGILFIISLSLAFYFALKQDKTYIGTQKNYQSTRAGGNNSPNIILIVFDALTARDMSVYGYYRNTTPFIAEWARKASLFTRAKSDSNFTTASTASLMTGKRVWTHRAFFLDTNSQPLRGNMESLPLVLKKGGYHTMAFVANPYASVSSLGITSGFDNAPDLYEFRKYHSLKGWVFLHMHLMLSKIYRDKIKLWDWIIRDDFILMRLLNLVYPDFTLTEVPPEIIFNKFLKIINNTETPFFAWLHIYPPHDPYLPPEQYSGIFDDSSAFRNYSSQWNAINNFHVVRSDNNARILRARYDEFIRYCDRQFENFIIQLESINMLKNTVVILTSDHGESFDHDYIGHGGTDLYEHVTHIPLIIKEPKQTEGRIIDDIVGQIDITATVIEIAGISNPSWMEGRSLVPLIRGNKFQPLPVFSMSFVSNQSSNQPITRGSVAVWKGDYKMIHYLDDNRSLLYNLTRDPDELYNLFEKEAEVGQHLLTIIQEQIEMSNAKTLSSNNEYSLYQ